jgi:phenylalanyl-tRNA synthetase beta chain
MGARRPVHFSEPVPPSFDEWDAKALAADVAHAAFPGDAVELLPSEDAASLWRIVVAGRDCGEVRPVVLDAPPWAKPAFGVELVLGEFSLEPVAPPGKRAAGDADDRARAASVRYRALPVMPAAEFDLALFVPDAVPAGRVEAVLRRAAGDLLERLVLFDRFRGKGVPEGHSSLAWRLTFRHPERTLNDKEIGGRRQKIITTLEKELGVVTRTS